MILVVRHAPVAVTGVCYGQIDVATSVDADEASAAILDQLASVDARVVRVWASPWLRARLPAWRVARGLDVPLTVDARLSELAFGAWEGRTYADLEAHDPGFDAWMRRWRDAAPPGGERVDDLVARVDAVRRTADVPDRAVLFVTHAGPIRALRAWSRGVDFADLAMEPVVHLRLEPVPPRSRSTSRRADARSRS